MNTQVMVVTYMRGERIFDRTICDVLSWKITDGALIILTLGGGVYIYPLHNLVLAETLDNDEDDASV